MKISRIALLLPALAASVPLARAVPPDHPSPSASEESQRLLDELASINAVPGMGAAIWQDGKIVWTGSTGFRDVERQLPVDEKTIFRMASVSKLLTATAAAKLAEQKRLDLDAPVAQVLPWLRNGWAPISSRQLAAHTSGLGHYEAADEGRGAVRYPSSRAAVGIFADRPQVQKPGQSYRYSSWGYTLLGAVVEEVSGTPLPDYLRREVTYGLQIDRDATDGPDPNASKAYRLEPKGGAIRLPLHDFSYTWGGGGMAGTPEAVATFGGRMIRNEVVSGESFEAMLRPYQMADGNPASAEGYKVGFGWRTSTDENGDPVAHHNGVTLGARSALVLWRGDQMAVSLLSNAQWTSSIDRTARMLAAPFRALPRDLVAAPCVVGDRRYTGTFADKPISGTASFRFNRGMCVGTLTIDGEFQQWLGAAEGGRTDRLKVVGLDRAGGLARAGLVTPYGIYDWRAQADGSIRVNFSDTRQLSIRLIE